MTALPGWIGLLYPALVALCLSMDRHWRQVFPGRKAPRHATLLRGPGFAGLLASLVLCLSHANGARAWVDWCCTFAVLAGTLSLTLALAPRWVPASAAAGLALGLASGLLTLA
ncbi:DUF3325 domain-containing protein [Pseudomonas sp. HR96]|uniref:DUF3325 domain-containing protein n=1 Tax=Pseudomonas sp. HR96 TaxID=1027966 RepID=UPI002A756913|nr:DUF3325 domain-containing protein [Pseudomonas sp. HR96]WPO97936.1 DUF3325 domain-containing protein [Pseudomonas sp. HR96]